MPVVTTSSNGFTGGLKGLFTTSTSPIIHFVYLPKFCVRIVFNFLWEDLLKTIFMQNLGDK